MNRFSGLQRGHRHRVMGVRDGEIDDDLDLEKDEDLRTYALISVFTGLGLSATSVPFIVVGIKRKKVSI